MRINQKYNYKTSPLANEKSIVKGDKYRFTILTSKLIRIEYNENGIFEDRATQSIIDRNFPLVDFNVEDSENLLVITTEHVKLRYTKQPFSKNSLSLCYTGELTNINACSPSSYWYFGDKPAHNLFGTTRTLDDVDGECDLEEGIMSMKCICVIDDSTSLILDADGWVDPRTENCIDQYLFCYAKADGSNYDYLGALKDFYKLTGKTPLLPRYSLGNWWSRYHAYTQEEYLSLMKRFKKEEIPFSVAVIDMDWHYVKIDSKYGNGWTGYTWNKELFPDHVEFLKTLHEYGMKTSLNLHPQGGVAAHEEAYPQMARAMGIDPETERKVEFDITNPEFLEKYFEILHHPMEEEGVDFWWLDWQQGNTSSVPGLDPLWMLNHYHYIDNGRDGKRALMFSRYSGVGSHRYPIGFSGDTHITWASLDFQPYFTATASNIGYGWWSHDIGGHMHGDRDEELITRWIQLGTFSPINRLHSANNDFTGKEPWKYNKISEISMKKFLKLRHELIPYIYTMNYRAHTYDEPLVQPLYYKYSGAEVYSHKNEFCFGTEMLVSPITHPHDRETTLGHSDTYLPEGIWFDFFSGRRYKGGRTLSTYRDLYNMPVFVKAGGIIPMAKLTHVNDIENPEHMKIKVFAGASNVFELYEDDGLTTEFKNGKFAFTKFELDWSKKPVFTIYAPEGDTSVIPEKRSYEIEFIGATECKDISVTVDGKPADSLISYVDGVTIVESDKVKGEIVISFNAEVYEKANDIKSELISFLEPCYTNNNQKAFIAMVMEDEKLTLTDKLVKLNDFKLSDDMRKAITEILIADVK